MREQRRAPGPARAWLDDHTGEPLGISVFVACELEAGATAAAHPERERMRVRETLKAVAIVFPDERFAAAYGALWRQLQQRRRTLGTMDLLIATTATIEAVPVLTGNRRHFEDVPDLEVLSYR